MEEITRQEVLRNLNKELENIKRLSEIETEENIPIQENENFRDPLSIEEEKTIRVLLSWGGGSDGYKLTFNKENELLRGVYFMANWGTYKEIELNEEELDLIFNVYLYGEYPNNL